MRETGARVPELHECNTTIRYFHHGLQSIANGVQLEQRGGWGLGLGSLLPPSLPSPSPPPAMGPTRHVLAGSRAVNALQQRVLRAGNRQQLQSVVDQEPTVEACRSMAQYLFWGPVGEGFEACRSMPQHTDN